MHNIYVIEFLNVHKAMFWTVNHVEVRYFMENFKHFFSCFGKDEIFGTFVQFKQLNMFALHQLKIQMSLLKHKKNYSDNLNLNFTFFSSLRIQSV